MNLFVSPKEFFAEAVREGLRERRVESFPRAEDYLVELLQFYLDAKNLFDTGIDQKKPQTLAEMYLIANQSEPVIRQELLKQLGDRTLYISGFFGESLKRKIVDVDYYVEMGGSAYRDLASATGDETLARVYHAFSKRFIEYADVLTYISTKSLVQSNNDVLRLYETYLKTGSEVARDRLIEMGVVLLPSEQAKKTQQY